jgi:uncharacterized protein (TIGR04255 family)
VTLPPDFRAQALADVGKQLATRFPKSEEFIAVEARLSPALPPAQRKSYHGQRFKSEDGTEIVQFRIDGFTYNRLKPYPGWDAFFPQALDLWRLYVATTAPEAVTRMAVRYINHLELPALPDDLSRFLTAPPTLPEAIPGRITGFRNRVSVHDTQAGLSAHLTQACDPNPEPGALTVTLDVDAYKPLTSEIGDNELVAMFGALHDFKNALFFGSITEATAEMYE